MKSIIALGVAGLLFVGSGATAGTPAEPNMVADTCSVCHGDHGISPNSGFPNLAAQTKTYLVTQLKAFKDRSRADPAARAYMWNMAGTLPDRMIENIADYFAAQPPAKGVPAADPAEAAAGKTIFDNGINSEAVPPCASCHGPKAAGSDTFPRLAGQHYEYLLAQLRAFRSGERQSDIMQPVAHPLTDQQMRQVAAYLASL